MFRRALFRGGRLPDDLRAQLTAEGLLLLEEELPGTITYRHYRAPHRRSSFEKKATTNAIAITSQRVLIWLRESKHLDIPFTDDRFASLTIVVEDPQKICIAYNPADFNPATSGRVEVRLRTPRAAEIAALLTR